MPNHEMRAGRTRVVIDEESGAMVRLEDTVSGRTHVASNPDRFLFRITLPRDRWTSRYVDNVSAPPRVAVKTGNELVLHWRNLPAPDGPSGLDVEVRFQADPSAGEIRLVLNIANRGPDCVTDLHAPIIAGWTGIGGKGQDSLVLGGHKERDPHRLPVNIGTTYSQLFQKARAEYPTDLYAPWIDLSGPGGGISLLNYMETPRNGTVFEYNACGHEPGFRLAFGWRTPCVLQPGAVWSSPPFGLSVHGGDWHDTADRYRAWMDTWFTPPPGKRELREMIGFQNVWLRGFDGTPFHELADIPRLAADGRRFGVEHLCVWDEVSIGMYEHFDGRDILAYSPEEKAILRQALRQARDEGTNVNALVNFRLFPSSPAYMDRYLGDASRLLDGSLRTENYALSQHSLCGWTPDRGPTNCVASPFAQAYRERVARWTEEYLDLGYVSMFYDQPFESSADYGRIADGCRPEDTYAAMCSLVAQVRQRLHRNNPDAYVIGEYCEAFMAQHIDLWMSWYRETAPALRAAYSLPHTMQAWVVDTDFAQASRAFAMGLYLCLCTRGNERTLAAAPRFGEHVLKLAKLRKRCAERTVHARFRDNRGIRVQTDGGGVAYAYDGPAGPAVVAAAPDAGCRVTVEVDRAGFSAPGSREGRLYRLDGRVEPVSGDQREFILETDEVAIWTL